jgi:hypothetical protein
VKPLAAGASRTELNQEFASKDNTCAPDNNERHSRGLEYGRGIPGLTVAKLATYLVRMVLNWPMCNFCVAALVGLPTNPGARSPGGMLIKRWALRPRLYANCYNQSESAIGNGFDREGAYHRSEVRGHLQLPKCVKVSNLSLHH